MRLLLQLLAGVLALGALTLWLVTGAHRGWTQTTVQKRTMDDVTGIEGITYEHRFVMGLEFLGLAGLGAGLLAGGSFLFHHKQNNQATNIISSVTK
jgi:hypothetical protein